MIFASVGTHEDAFNRLVDALDALVESGVLKGEPVQMQRGYSKEAKNFPSEAMMPFDAVQQAMKEARIVITHGGPATIMQALSHGKIPIVVPRNPQFGEHVDGHQLQFARRLAARVLVVEEIESLGPTIKNYDALVQKLKTGEPPKERAARFAEALDSMIHTLVEKP
jgi:UDP-N-acetylglucosamine transferase subunit ALG13